MLARGTNAYAIQSTVNPERELRIIAGEPGDAELHFKIVYPPRIGNPAAIVVSIKEVVDVLTALGIPGLSYEIPTPPVPKRLGAVVRDKQGQAVTRINTSARLGWSLPNGDRLGDDHVARILQGGGRIANPGETFPGDDDEQQ